MMINVLPTEAFGNKVETILENESGALVTLVNRSAPEDSKRTHSEWASTLY